VVWAILAAQAFARGLVLDNCGCFGTYLAQPLRWYVLVEDALMQLYAWLLSHGLRRSPACAPHRPDLHGAPTPRENH
jgi:hypothetical protein